MTQPITSNATLKTAGSNAVNDAKIEINHQVALLQVSLAKSHKDEAEKYMSKIKQEQAWQPQCSESAKIINDTLGKGDGFYLITTDMYDLYKSFAEKSITLDTVYDGNGKTIGYSCSEDQLNDIIGEVNMGTVDYEILLSRKEKALEKLDKDLKKEQQKKKPDAKKIEGYEKDIQAAKDKIAEYKSALEIKSELKKVRTDNITYYDMPDDIVKLCNELNIEVPEGITQNGKHCYKEADLKALAVKLKDAESNLNDKIKDDMVYLQNALGQYNALIEGSSYIIANAAQWGLEVARLKI